MISITVNQEDLPAETFDFDPAQEAIAIGRRAGNDLRISCRSVSGEHARIEIVDGAIWIEDLNSTNGTYVNGRLVNRHRLRDGDDVVMGRARLAVKFELPTVGDADTEPVDDSSVVSAVADRALADDARLKGDLEPYARKLAARYEHTGNDIPTEVAAPRRRYDDSNDIDDIDNIDNIDDAGSSDDDSDDSDGHAPDRSPVSAPPTLRPSASRSHTATGKHSAAERDTLVALAADAARPAPADPPHGLQAAHDALLDETETATGEIGRATIEIINGAKSGQTLPIDKPVTTLGRPGIQIAAIMRKPNGYFLMHVESDDHVGRPTLNDDEIGDEPVQLHNGDELQVAGVEVQFTLS